MRGSYIVLALCFLSACGEKPAERSADRVFDVRSEPPPAAEATGEITPPGIVAPPNITPSAAPGVAFAYRYAFRLPADRIGAVQEKHAQACEKLGIDRCRIVGMRYRLVDDENISAMLAFKLEPSLARQFGKDGIAAVTEAEGMLVDSEIAGEDAGAAITAARRAEARLREEQTRLEARLKQSGLGVAERESLNDRLEEITRSLNASQAGRDEKKESLATTPMAFNYGSGELVPGFDGRSPIGKAFATAGELLVGAVATMIVVAGALLPIAILIALILIGWRLAVPRVAKWQASREAATGAQA